MKCHRILLALFLSAMSGCIEIDRKDDPIVGERVEIESGSYSVMIGQTVQAKATYFDLYGLEKTAPIVWTVSSPSIITVDDTGLIRAKSVGQALLFARAGTASDTARVVVVGDVNSVASIQLSSTSTNLSVGNIQDIMISVLNVNGVPLSNKQTTWQSSNPAIVSVNTTGRITALADGTASISASSEGVISNSLIFQVGSGLRSGTFMKSGGYEASGMALLKIDNGKLILQLASDFKTSFALGTFIYLSNTNTSGAVVRSSGFEVKQITQNGAHSFEISMIDPGVKISDFKYVIVLCKPAGVIFGFAELK
ncbi:MAG: Ig-like domain-containing protein [Cyclobacteriaceae bacterium]|nr:Ig-like domain-containing protein [Cyclobacteriaceae bacterium]